MSFCEFALRGELVADLEDAVADDLLELVGNLFCDAFQLDGTKQGIEWFYGWFRHEKIIRGCHPVCQLFFTNIDQIS